MSGREIDYVVFRGSTKVFEETSNIAFLLLLRRTYIGNVSFLNRLVFLVRGLGYRVMPYMN